jgi:thioredoxin-like negative regulator of GroEL
MQPILTKLGIRHIDIDKEPELAERAHIKAVPTTIVTDDNGREITRFVGKLSESRLKQLKQRPVVDSVRRATKNAVRALFGQRGIAL